MADDARPDERTEDPTPKRREEFRNRGEVAKSQELGSVAVLMAAMAGLWLMGPRAANRMAQATVEGLDMPFRHDLDVATVQRLTFQVMGAGADMVLPILLAILLAGVAINVAQTGWLVAPEAIKLKWERLNPFPKAQELFLSSRTAFEATKVLLKSVVIGVPLVLAIEDELAIAPGLIGMDAGAVGLHTMLAALRIAAKIAALLILIALADFGYQKWSLHRRMRMTVQELKEEMKDSEGDPWIKGRRRAIAREMSMNRMMAEVPRADVVVNNPTHFSVALRYEAGTGSAPRVVAKGQDLIALRIREIAKEHGVPMVEDAPLARAIYKTVEVGKEIPAALYRAVAEVLAVVYRQRGRAAALGARS